MPDLFAIYIAQRPYQDDSLGHGWRTHRYLMLANEAAGVFRPPSDDRYIPEQELHYVKFRHTKFLKAMVYQKGRIVRLKAETPISNPIERGSEYDVRGAWNRALATAVALNKEDIPFADVHKISEVSALNTCDAGLQAGLDAMGIIHDFGRAGLFREGLYESVAAQVPDIDPSETLEDRRAASVALMEQVQKTRKMMKG